MSETYRIKPLAWEKQGRDRWAANTPLGQLRSFKSTWDGKMKWDCSGESALPHECDSIEDGKTKAEAYYRERLMQALELVR